MKKAKKSSIFLLGVLIIILGVTAYTSIITVWDMNPTVGRKENTPEAIRIPERPKTSAEYTYNLTVDNNPGSGITWADRVSEAWCSGSGTAGDPYLIENHIIQFNNSDNGQYACINISNSHNVYFKISGVTTRNNASDVGIGISLSNCTNGAIINVNASYNGDEGIYIVDSQNITIADSMMRNNNERGLYMVNVTTSTISNCTMIYQTLSGARCDNCTYNVFQSGNLFTNNSYGGLGFYDSDYNNITDSYFYNNSITGIGLTSSDYCYILNNFIEDQSFTGLIILNSSGDSVQNHIYGNTFETNTIQAYSNGSLNLFDNGVDRGNYWSNYAGADLDDDGIGDTPHGPLLGEEGARDRYPIWDDGDDTAPAITIVEPFSDWIYVVIPQYSLTIVEAEGIYNRWYTLDGGLHNTTFTGTTGTISATEWVRITGPQGSIVNVIITFYVNDTSGNIGSATVRIKTYIPESVKHGKDSDEVYMYSFTKNQIYILLAFSFSLSLILRLFTLRTRKR